MKRSLIPIVLAAIMIFAAIGVVSVSAYMHPGSHQTISIETVDSHGNPVKNVSVQGVMQLPPTVYNGTVTVFVGATSNNGIYTVNNTTYIHRAASLWLQYEQYHSDAFSPFIMVFLTYNSENSTYVQQTSIELTPEMIMKGESYSALAHLTSDKKNMLVADPLVQSHSASANGSSSYSQGTLRSGINNNPSTKWESLSNDQTTYYWTQQNASLVAGKNGQALELPMCQAMVGGSAIAQTLVTVSGTSIDEAGSIINPYSSTSVHANTGAPNGQNSGSYYFQTGTTQVTSSGGIGWAWNYILGNFTVENYELEYHDWGWKAGYYRSAGDYQTLMGIIQIETSGSNILGDNAYSQPYYYHWEANNTVYEYIPNDAASNSTFNINNTNHNGYDYTRSSIPAHTSESQGELPGLTISIGTIILAAAAFPEAQVAATIAGIVPSAMQTSLNVIKWGYPENGNLFVSSVEYTSTDSYAPNFYLAEIYPPFTLGENQVEGPTIDAYVYAAPPAPTASTGAGGYVLNGSTISLSDGSSVPVQDLRPGMKTLSYDVNTGNFITTTVTRVIESNVSMIMNINNGELFISGMGDQPVFVKLSNDTEEWLTIGQLTTNMQIFDALNNTWIHLTSIALQFGNFTVYNVNTANELQNGQTVGCDYMANGLLVDM